MTAGATTTSSAKNSGETAHEVYRGGFDDALNTRAVEALGQARNAG